MPDVLCFGDSNTYGYAILEGRFAKGIPWPEQYTALLKGHATVRTNGVCGRYLVSPSEMESILDGGNQLRRLVLATQPDAMVLQLGTNDVLANVIGSNALGTYLARLLEDLRTARPDLHLCVLLPGIQNGETLKAWSGTTYGDLMGRVARLKEAFKDAADNCGALWLDTDAVEKDTDGIHLTACGHSQLAGLLYDNFRPPFGTV